MKSIEKVKMGSKEIDEKKSKKDCQPESSEDSFVCRFG